MVKFGKTYQACCLAGLGLAFLMATPRSVFGDDLYLYGGGGGSFANGSSGGQNGGIVGGPKGGDGNGAMGGGGGGNYIGTNPNDTSGITSGQDGANGGAAGQHYVEDGLEDRMTVDIGSEHQGVQPGTSTNGGQAARVIITFNDAYFDSVSVRSGMNGTGAGAGRGAAWALRGSLSTNNLTVYNYSSGGSNTETFELHLKMIGSTATIDAYLDGVPTTASFKLASLDVGDSSTTVNAGTGRLMADHLFFGSGELTVDRLRATASGSVLTLYGTGAKLNTSYTGSVYNQGFHLRELNARLPDNYDGQSMLTLTGNTFFGITDGTTVNVSMEGALAVSPGERMTLVEGPIYNFSNPGENRYFQNHAARSGGVTRDLFDIEIIAGTIDSGVMTYNGEDGIYAYYTGLQTYSDAALIYSESYLAGIFSLNSGLDLLQGIPGDIAYQWQTSRECQVAAKRGPWESTGVTPFIKGEFSRLRHKTGSRVKHENYSFAVGASNAWDTGVGQFIVGGFVEAGTGSYDSYNSFTDPDVGRIGDVHGQGDTDYLGGGLFARHDFDLGLYAEASLRGGKVKHDFETSDLYGSRDTYDADTGYWGAHFGLGYKTAVYGEADALDFYAKFLFTHENSQSVTDSASEKLAFDAVDSVRARVGVKATHQINSVVRGYAGAAFEHEFDSELTARINGSDIKTIGLKGHSLIGEVGAKLTPLPEAPFSVDAGAFFIGGERKGGGGSVSMRYYF